MRLNVTFIRTLPLCFCNCKVKLDFRRYILVKVFSVMFQQNPTIGRRVFPRGT